MPQVRRGLGPIRILPGFLTTGQFRQFRDSHHNSETDAGNTIPDLLGKAIGEIKNVQYIYNTGQIQAQLAAAEASEMPYYLIVSPTTQVAGTTMEAVTATGGQVLSWNAATGALTDVATGITLDEIETAAVIGLLL